MLNIMLMRANEAAIFNQTRDWLAADRANHRFHLIVDELHLYRGTAGTEVALLLRKLITACSWAPTSSIDRGCARHRVAAGRESAW